MTPGTLYNQFNSFYFIDENIGWVCGSGLDVPGGVILKTTNGGNSWCLTSSVAIAADPITRLKPLLTSG